MAKNKETRNSNYSATITDSSREFTPKERVMFKDLGNAISMNNFAEESEAVGGKAIIETVKDFCVVSIHNEQADHTDYDVYVLIDAKGEKYYTSSEPFWNSFMDIYAEMKECDEQWGIQLNLLPSKKYAGKKVLTCSLI